MGILTLLARYGTLANGGEAQRMIFSGVLVIIVGAANLSGQLFLERLEYRLWTREHLPGS